jgi:hypothetical protein
MSFLAPMIFNHFWFFVAIQKVREEHLQHATGCLPCSPEMVARDASSHAYSHRAVGLTPSTTRPHSTRASSSPGSCPSPLSVPACERVL